MPISKHIRPCRKHTKHTKHAQSSAWARHTAASTGALLSPKIYRLPKGPYSVGYSRLLGLWAETSMTESVIRPVLPFSYSTLCWAEMLTGGGGHSHPTLPQDPPLLLRFYIGLLVLAGRHCPPSRCVSPEVYICYERLQSMLYAADGAHICSCR